MSSRAGTSRLGGATALLVLSIVFHAIYLSSIFDIYFVSPVTRVGVRYGVGSSLVEGGPGAEVGEALAKRVVLIVGDGLRADKLFQQYPSPPFPYSDPLPSPVPNEPDALVSHNSTTPAPFVRNLIQSGKAQWGVSHTRVPTESRPGHVALIGGMYEDVSAVTRGWQTNPVSFDSVFNQSSHTFSFGSPDILPMFKQGASDPDRVDAWSYGDEYEDFSADAVHLDLWVLDQLKTLLHNATASPNLDTTLRAPGTVFFLHLLGLDTTGHSYRPHGPEYHRNIRVLDYVVKETVQVLNDFFHNDDETAYVLTADHGMSSKGNHGDGEPDNTRTPLVAWGAGIKSGLETLAGDGDAYSADWGLMGTRRDVEQADVAVLMSILGGLAIPANSAGSIPLDILDATPSFKARAAYANAQQLLAEFSVKNNLKEAHAVSYRPFPGLVDSSISKTKSIQGHRDEIQGLLAAERYLEVQTSSRQLMRIAQEGIRYFQTYDWLILRSMVTLGYVGFVLYSGNFILRHHVLGAAPALTSSASYRTAISGVGIAVFAALAGRFVIERSSATYYFYAIFPCFLWTSIIKDFAPLRHLFASAARKPISSLVGSILALGCLELMVYGYMDRRIFSALVLAMGFGWPLAGMSQAFRKSEAKLLSAWAACSSALAIFPLLPVEKGESILVILLGASVFVAIGCLALVYLVPTSGTSLTLKTTRRFVQSELILTIASAIVTASSAKSLQDKQGLPRLNQVLGWTILTLATLVPVAHGRPKAQPVAERLFVLLFAFAPIFIILSLSYEALFYATFAVTLCLWVAIESRLVPHKHVATGVSADHIRVALFFLSFLHVAFFGVGNVASISSFYLEPVYRLIPVFAPFPMAALLLYKLLIPFVALSAVSSVLTHRLHLPPFSLFIIASTLSDVLTINFFFLVSDQGSWLEIGSTITNFAICSLLCIFNTALFLIGEAALESTTL